MNKKIIAIIIGAVIVVAGVGIYYSLSNSGYINPGIHIDSFGSTSNSYQNDSYSSEVPVFYAHVNSSKTSEYELNINGKTILHGVVTGSENITVPSTLSKYIYIAAALATPGLHNVTFKILYNSFSTSKSIEIYTFPSESFTVVHHYIDTGISDQITASNPVDNISINGQKGPTYNFVSSSAGTYNISYSMSYQSFHYSGIAKQIHVCNKPEATGIYYTNYSYCSLFDDSCFNLHMNEAGGDINSSNFLFLSFNYSIYVNGSYYTTVSCPTYSLNSLPGTHDTSYYLNLNGKGPYNIYYIAGDRYYNDSKSNTIEVP